MDLMTIGAFAGRTRLSAKALRLYDRLGLLPPARVDPDSGYRFYGEDQVATARLIALLRRLGMPLTAIADIAAKPPGEAARWSCAARSPATRIRRRKASRSARSPPTPRPTSGWP
jgi:DNA-binding transcriptional MerR regulator